MPSLEGPRLKLERAKEHLDSLQSEGAAYLARKPYAVVHEAHPEDATRHIGRSKIHEEPPARLGLILGDAVHNMRSALDHLVFQLALQEALVHGATLTPREEKRSQFPIYKDSGLYNAEGLSRIDKLPSAAKEKIEALQPYHRGQDAEGHLFWLLHEADIADKHRTIMLRRSAYVIPLGDVPLLGEAAFMASFKDGDPAVMVSADTDPDNEVKPEFSYTVLFDIGGVSHPVTDFYRVHKFISEYVLPGFAGFFPQPLDTVDAGIADNGPPRI